VLLIFHSRFIFWKEIVFNCFYKQLCYSCKPDWFDSNPCVFCGLLLEKLLFFLVAKNFTCRYVLLLFYLPSWVVGSSTDCWYVLSSVCVHLLLICCRWVICMFDLFDLTFIWSVFASVWVLTNSLHYNRFRLFLRFL